MCEVTEKNSARIIWPALPSGGGGEENHIALESKHSVKTPGGDHLADRRAMEPRQQDICSEAHLRQITGEEDLAGLRSLVLTVDTNATQVDHLGGLMPLLAELRLERGSTLASFRDLGNSLSHLRVLWLSACGIFHLDGVGALSGLEELYLAFNDVEDLTSIALHDRLEVLDLESNNVGDSDQAIHLGTCSRLWSLNLCANPVCRERYYRRHIVEAIPHLASLDESDITDDDRRPLSAGSDESDRRHQTDPFQTFATIPSTPSRHHLSMTPFGKIHATTKTQGDFPASRPPESAGKVGRQTLSGSRSELQFQRAHSSTQEIWQAGDIPASPDIENAARDVQKPTAALHQSPVPGCFGQRARRGVDDRNDTCTEDSAARSIAAENNRISPSSSLAHVAVEDRHAKADGTERGEGEDKDRISSSTQSEFNSRRVSAGHGEHSSGHGVYRGEHDRPGISSSLFAAHFVDEEEMVAKAIKSFRIFSETNTAGNSPRRKKKINDGQCSRRAAVECENLLGSSARSACWTTVNNRGERQTTGGMSLVKEKSTSLGMDSKKRCPPRESGGEMDYLTAQDDVEIDGTPAGGEARGDRDDIGFETRGGWAGTDWLLKILSLPDMRPSGISSGSQPSLQAAETAASMLTHGSEVSFAGNPALGLRHRRRPYETFDGLSRTMALKTQARLHAAGVRRDKNGDDRQRPESIDRSACIRRRDKNTSKASRLSEDGYAIGKAFSPQEGSGEGDAEKDREKEADGVHENGEPPTSIGETCATEQAYAYALPCSWPSSCSATDGDRRRKTFCSPDEVSSLSSRAVMSPMSSTRIQQHSGCHCKPPVGAKATDTFDKGKAEERIAGDPSGSSQYAEALAVHVGVSTIVDHRKRHVGAKKIIGGSRTVVHSNSVTNFRASSSTEVTVSIKDDMATCKTRWRLRQPSEGPAELNDADPDGRWWETSSTRVVRKGVEVPEWSPTTGTDACRCNKNGADDGTIENDGDTPFSFVGKSVRAPNAAVRNRLKEGFGQLGSSSEEPVASAQSTRGVGQGLEIWGKVEKDGDDDSYVSGKPWLADAEAWSADRFDRAQMTRRDQELQNEAQKRFELRFTEGYIAGGGGGSPMMKTGGFRRGSSTKTPSCGTLRRKGYNKKTVQTKTAGGIGSDVYKEVHGEPPFRERVVWARDERLVPLPGER